MNPRDRIEKAFAAWGRVVYRRAPWAILAVLLVVAALATQLPKFDLDTSIEAFLHEDDPHRVTYDAFRAQFGRDEMILVAIRSDGDLFRREFLEKLRDFHDEIESEVPLLVEVTSLVNARNTRGEADELIVEDLLEEWPETDEQLAAVRERALSNPLYRDQLLSQDGTLTTVVVETEAYSQIGVADDELGGFEEDEGGEATTENREPLTGWENSRIVTALMEVVERHQAPDFEIHVAGTPTMMEVMQSSMRRDMGRFTGMAVLAIAILLGVLFRRVAGVILPIVTVILSVVSTIAIMVGTGTQMSLPTQILPSFLLAVGVCHSVHVLAIFYQQRRQGATKEDAISFAMGHSALAVVMTSLTTAGGLLSFSVAELAPIAEFGIFGPVGVVVALVYTIVLLPALIAVFPMRDERPEAGREPLSRRLLVRCGEFSTRHAGAVTLATLGLVGVCLLGAFQISFSHDPMNWFKEGLPFRVANDLINDEMRGTMFLEAIVETEGENGLHEPAILNGMRDFQEDAWEIQVGKLFVGKTVSLADVLMEIHQALNENRPEFYAIPQDRQLVAQELLLFENSGSDDLEDVVDSQFSMGRITLKAPFVDAINYKPFIEAIEASLGESLGEGATYTITGVMSVMGRTINAVVHTMAKSYLMAFVIITPLMVILIGRLRIGLVSMIPNLSPIIIALGIMGWRGIPLDAFTLMIGSIALGLAVDDTIHFLHNFRRYFDRSGDVEEAVRETLSTTGQAMLFTTLVLSTGFFFYTLSEMNNLFYFGLLTGLTIILALLADIILAPALMALVARPRRAPQVGTATMEVTR